MISNSYADHWSLSPDVVFLNHGSFGACPTAVLEAQQDLRQRMERQPVQFFVRDLEGMLDEARQELADFLGASAGDIAWVPNATAGVNAVLRSLSFRRGDELLTTNHEYNAVRNALEFVAARSGARVVVAQIPFPAQSPEEVVEAILAQWTPQTVLALFDHVTSQTGMVLPVAELIAELNARGVDTLIDGAHAPGMVELNLDQLGAAYYTGNCHKWLCAPKGAGFLHVRSDRQRRIRPLAISHGANSPRSDRSRYLVEFDWMGTDDPTPMLCVPVALRHLESLIEDGWDGVRRRNHETVVGARRHLCEVLGTAPPCPEPMLGSLATLPLPPGGGSMPSSPLYTDPLQQKLLDEHAIEVPVVPFPAPPARLLRISAQLYNDHAHYERLGSALQELLAEA